jgi:hypothetical protein
VETIDLSSHLRGSPKREFKKEVTLGKKTAQLEVSFTQSTGWNTCRISITTARGRRYFSHFYQLNEVPTSLPPDMFRWVGGNRFGCGPYHRWVRFRTTGAFLLRLTEAYEEIVSALYEVRHEDLHGDNQGYDD